MSLQISELYFTSSYGWSFISSILNISATGGGPYKASLAPSRIFSAVSFRFSVNLVKISFLKKGVLVSEWFWNWAGVAVGDHSESFVVGPRSLIGLRGPEAPNPHTSCSAAQPSTLTNHALSYPPLKSCNFQISTFCPKIQRQSSFGTP